MAFSSRRITHAAFQKAQRENEDRQRAEAILAVISERERMGRDLHDGLGQVLCFIVVQSQAISMLLSESQIPEAQANLHRLEKAASDAALNVRQHILGLRSNDGRKGFVDLLQEYITQFKEFHTIQINLSLPEDLTSLVIAEEMQEPLLRVIQESLTNAAKHAQPELVTVTFQIIHDTIQVFISDNGKGFELNQNIGDEHFGLKIMRERMEQMHGTFEVRSKPGSGTQVLLSLPRGAFITKETENLKSLRIMIVDDHPLFLEGLHNLLVVRGFTVVGSAQDGQEALDKALILNPDVILMDLNMPHMTGIEATRQIKAMRPGVKIIILTVSDNEENLYQALLNGASGFLLKNLDGDKLSTMLFDLTQGETPITPVLVSHLASLLTRSTDLSEFTNDLYGLSAQQLGILRMVRKGKTYKEIGHLMGLSEATIKYHMSQILKRLNLSTREEALLYLDEKNTRNRMIFPRLNGQN
jgi:DNA-binding NarL/FixJ family response regulator/anti-sigma regulatory factor (Ser/Thr protein kinase)